MDVNQIPIIPTEQTFYNKKSNKLINWEPHSQYELDLSAISYFIALGFMLEDSTYFTDIKVLQPSTKYTIDTTKNIQKLQQTWEWHYSPSDRSFDDILEEFSSLFEKLIINNIKNKSVLLPISGGLDSRTLFVPLKNKSKLTLSSYEFEDGLSESETGKQLSKRFKIPLYSEKIQRGYLWSKLDEFHQLNKCFADFTHPRQVAVIPQWKGLGDVILLGHWGDVLFDKQADLYNISYDEQVMQLKKKIMVPGGIELATDLWKHWGLEGSFETNISDRLDRLYRKIKIDHPSARIRAFKSLNWAPRYTSINLSIFRHVGEMILPYYSDEMCKFICTVPERYLEGRKIQIEYIKRNCPEAAEIPWQKYYPLNLYQYQRFNRLTYYPVRAIKKIQRVLQKELFKSPELVTRNWELQFLGETNFLQLKKNLINRNKSNKIIPQEIIVNYLEKFQLNPIKYAHPVSMLLTLSLFCERYDQK